MKADFPYIQATTPMAAYFNDPSLKAEFVQRMQDHIAADEVIQGYGFVNGRGCAVGCTYDEYDHSLGPERLGFPQWYERARDAIFERLPFDTAKYWALASLQEVPVGVELNGLLPKLLMKVQMRNFDRIGDDDSMYSADSREFIKRVICYIASGDAPEDFEEEVFRNNNSAGGSNQRYIQQAVESAASSWKALNGSGYGASVATSSALYSAINSVESKAMNGYSMEVVKDARHAEAATIRDDLITLIHSAPKSKG